MEFQLDLTAVTNAWVLLFIALYGNVYSMSVCVCVCVSSKALEMELVDGSD